MIDKKRVVIIGAGFAGIETARNLEKFSDIVDVTLVSKTENFMYYPLLYKKTTNKNIRLVDLPIKDFISSKTNLSISEVLSIDTVEKKVNLSGKDSISYDFLVMAVGSVGTNFGIPGCYEHMFQFRTTRDAEVICEKVLKSGVDENFVIVGAGPTGVEIAGEIKNFLTTKKLISKTKQNVILVEGGARVLPQVSEKASMLATKRLTGMGVVLNLNSRVMSYDGECLKTSNGDVFSKNVIWASGLICNPLVKEITTELDKRGRLIVDEYLEVLNHPNIFAVGDCAVTKNSGLAQTAIYDGKFVAQTIISKIKSKELKKYNFKNAGYSIPIGKDFALTTILDLTMNTFLGYYIRKAIDLKYFVPRIGLFKYLKNR